jgi:NADH:ubiquinone oxidoreductase subunit 6 (subunit J)
MNTAAFIVIAILTLAGALAAASLRKLIHAALCLVIAFIGIAAFFFLLGAEFVGLVQVFVYVGAVAVLIVFTILLQTPALSVAAPPIEALTVKRIGEALMTDYIWPLQCVGLLLTAALIGGLILVMEERRP